MSELANKLEALIADASPAPWSGKYHAGAGFQLMGPLERTNCVEFTIKKQNDFPFIQAADDVLMGYEPWIQFAPADYKKIQGANFALMAELRNNVQLIIDALRLSDDIKSGVK